MPDEPTSKPPGPVPPGYRYSLSPEQARRAREAFQSALDSAAPPYELGQLHLFHDDEESFIRKEVERMLYEPQLPNGGQKERRMIERLKRLARQTDWAGKDRAAYAASRFEKILPENPRHAGRYYMRKPMTPKGDKKAFDWAVALKESAHESREWDKKWFAQLMLDGLPEPVSNFQMECLFLLRKSDGSVDRLVRLRNVLGETSRGEHHGGSHILDAEAFASPEKFRRWALHKGGFAWSGNQTELHKLHEDNTHDTAWRVINQVDSVGWLRVPSVKGKTPGMISGIWFCDECAYANGQCLMPDDDGIYWWEGEGYYLSQRGREGVFTQGRPKMRPELRITDCDLAKENGGTPTADVGATLPEKKNGRARGGTRPKIRPAATDAELYRAFFDELCRKFYDTLGGYEGWLCLGAMFAYGAAPELFEDHRLFPGLWVHGQMSSGKTTVTEWMMAIWGFKVSAGIGLMKGTAVGLTQQCENYSNLPLWADEHRQGKVGDDKEAVLRDSFNRQSTVKWSPDGIQRQMRTSFVVSGESTSSDAATRSRFPHVQVSAGSRKADHLEWMTARKEYFFLFGRLLLERRAEFVTLLRGHLSDWLAAKELLGVSEREKIVHGIDWAAFMALTELLGTGLTTGEGTSPFTITGVAAFKKFMVEHARTSAADVSSETNVNLFWTDFINAFLAGDIDKHYFRLEWKVAEHPPGAPGQTSPTGGRTRWESFKLFMYPEPVIAAVQAYLVKQRANITLSRKDLRDQLSKNSYWMDGPDGKIKKRFGPDGQRTENITCWGFDMDKHPLAYQPCSSEDWDHYLMHPGEADPRKGPLFQIVHALIKEENKLAGKQDPETN